MVLICAQGRMEITVDSREDLGSDRKAITSS